MIRVDLSIKRVYDAPKPDDGYRILVDRLWPRGLTKDEAAVDEWVKELGPSNELRGWFGHDPAKYEGFRERYRAELAELAALWQPIVQRARGEHVTLVYGAKDTEHNQAVALREYLLEQG